MKATVKRKKWVKKKCKKDIQGHTSSVVSMVVCAVFPVIDTIFTISPYISSFLLIIRSGERIAGNRKT